MELMVPGQEQSLTVDVCALFPPVITFIIDAHSSMCLMIFTVSSCEALGISSSGIGGLALHFSAPNTTIGTRAIYSCSNSSYQIIGNAERTCELNGTWTGVEPQCECKQCVNTVL